ncbi:MAG: hypothetical protein LJE63_01890 [Desulfobacteraceae bacterium]|nr:hypothetical protein [Desulfobacteraceae bacterium]
MPDAVLLYLDRMNLKSPTTLKDHPQYWNEPTVETEFRFLMDKWPCDP